MRRHLRMPQLRAPAVAMIFAIAAFNMGNQSCDQKQGAQPRALKMDVRAGAVKARPMTMPNGEQVDFPSIASTLFFQQIMLSDRFVIANSIQPNDPPSESNGAQKPRAPSGVQKSDREVLEKYGFLRAARAAQYASAYRSAARASEFGSGGGEPGQMKAMAAMAAKDAAEAGAPLPTCLYELPQAYMSGEVLSFAAESAVGISVGYGAGPASVGGAIDFTNARLEVSARTDDPLSRQPLVIGSGVGTQEKVNFSFAFPAGVNVGLRFFYQTPVTNTIRKAMAKAIAAIVAGYEKMLGGKGGWNDVWDSRVLLDPVIANNDTHVVFRGGYRAGVQLGDAFSISNMRYAWTGEVCESALKYKIPTSTTPIATATVVSVGDNVSVAKVDYLTDARIEAGAQVKIKALVQPEPAPGATPKR